MSILLDDVCGTPLISRDYTFLKDRIVLAPFSKLPYLD